MADIHEKDRRGTGIFTEIDKLLMVEEDTRVGMCHAIHQYAIVNNNYKKEYDLRKKSFCHVY